VRRGAEASAGGGGGGGAHPPLAGSAVEEEHASGVAGVGRGTEDDLVTRGGDREPELITCACRGGIGVLRVDRARDGGGGIELVDQRSGGIEAIHPSHAVLTGGADERLAVDDRDGGAEAASGRTARRGERVAQCGPVVRAEDVGRAGILALRVVTRCADEDAL